MVKNSTKAWVYTCVVSNLLHRFRFGFARCHTPFQESGNEACIRVPRMFQSHVQQQYDKIGAMFDNTK
jgi:hypothetical protein